ncbi:putative membrane protein YeaQ/YmgE (transglycosylase-associated protein family) [Ancylobacter sp. 3268]|uniref:GlsB/YeaQ/YmgE family stress response membrane protein n=1 Tax=Ancylobacter sp. 3268 TaxID=2817752 RepID=UPI002864200E|nr:GlsB/YeaQ/YmgE family stress response membrane protein [Ancylobacter sp. 3268]MDR6951036.1 putative membrane protein YeaQ/YmgE (transglycosylase-associated protein family) [Ancylobacter sp. 3268]
MESFAAVADQPGVGWFTMIIIGLLAGWIAERVTESDHGLFANLLFGLIGAFVGKYLAELAAIPVYGFFRTLIAATVGAVIVLFIWRKLRSR